MYKENRLVNGRLRLRDELVDLRRIEQNLLVVTAGADHIAPPEGTVELRSAPWRARTNRATPIRAGEPVRVVGIDGLLLEVEPEGSAHGDHRHRQG